MPTIKNTTKPELQGEYDHLRRLLNEGIHVDISRDTLRNLIFMGWKNWRDLVDGVGCVKYNRNDADKLFKRQFMGRLGEYIIQQAFPSAVVVWHWENHYGKMDVSINGVEYDAKCSNYLWSPDGPACPQINLDNPIRMIFSYVCIPDDSIFDKGLEHILEHLEVSPIRVIAKIDDRSLILNGCDYDFGVYKKSGFVKFSTLQSLNPKEGL